MKKAIEYHFVIAVSVFVDGFAWNGHLNSSLFQCFSVVSFSVLFVFSLVSFSVLSSFLTTGLLCP